MKVNSFILMGNWLERTASLNAIKKAIGDYDLEVYDESYSWEYVRQSLLEHACFDENRLIILNGLPTVKSQGNSKAESPDGDSSASRTKVLNDLKKILPNVEGNTFVVLNGITITSKVFLDAIKDKVTLRSSDNMVPKSDGPTNAVKRLMIYFEQKGKEIKYDDAFLIVDSINYNSKDVSLDKVFLIAIKLENIIGSRKKITYDDIISICSSSPDFLIWNLFSALDSQDYAKSLVLVDRIVNGSLAFEYEVVMALSTMIWKYRMLLLVRTSLDNGMPIEQIWGKLKDMVKWDKTGQGIKRVAVPKMTKREKKITYMYSRPAMEMLFSQKYGKPTISCYSQEHLSKILPLTEMCLRKIRSGCTEGEIRIVLEILCLVICHQVQYDTAKEILKNNYCL